MRSSTSTSVVCSSRTKPSNAEPVDLSTVYMYARQKKAISVDQLEFVLDNVSERRTEEIADSR